MVAAACGHDAILRTLISIYRVDGFVSAGKQDPEGNDAVMLAARGGHAAALRLLLSYRASRTQHNSERCSAVHLLACAPDDAALTCLQLIAAEQPPAVLQALASRDNQGRNAAHHAAEARSPALLRGLTVVLGSSILVEADNNGDTPLDLLAAAVAASLTVNSTRTLGLPESPVPRHDSLILEALLTELEQKLSPSEVRLQARRRARGAGVSSTLPSVSLEPTPAEGALRSSANVGPFEAVVDSREDDVVADDEDYQYVDDATYERTSALRTSSLGLELRRRISGNDTASVGVFESSIPPPPSGPPLFGTQRSSSLGIDESAVSGAVHLPPDALGLSRQRYVRSFHVPLPGCTVRSAMCSCTFRIHRNFAVVLRPMTRISLRV